MSEHLFLLIGKNPLPNYVAAKLFLEQETKIHFIYTVGANGTEEYKNRIVAKLRSQYQANYFEVFDVPLVGASGASHIESAIENHFKAESSGTKIIQPGDSIHLNYTGGTKAMSVHVYRTIEKCADNNQLAFSYLNPRTLEMEFDDGRDPIGLNDPNKPEFGQTKIKLGDLMNLHGLQYQQRDDGTEIKPKKVIFRDLLDVIAGFQNDLTLLKKYLEFRSKNKTALEKPKPNTIVNIPTELTDLALALNKEAKKLNSRKDWVMNNRLIFGNIEKNPMRETVGNFIYSTWLETYALKQIVDLNFPGIIDSGSSFFVSRPIIPTQRFMEVDVFAMLGYQLFAVSCTVDNTARMCKKKIFEIAHRAKQLGGDEARIGLVCMAEGTEKNKLEYQLEKENIRVFGKHEFPKLKEEFKDWFEKGC